MRSLMHDVFWYAPYSYGWRGEFNIRALVLANASRRNEHLPNNPAATSPWVSGTYWGFAL